MMACLQHKTPATWRSLLPAVVLFFCIGAWTAIHAQPVQELYKSANRLYKESRFEEASLNYGKIIAQGYKTPEVYYNLGNCYYKLNNIGKAILNYERALRLAPEDEDIQHNLKLANTKVADKIQPVPKLGIITMWDNFENARTSGGWGMLALVFIWLALVGFAVYLFIQKRITATLGILLLMLSVAFISLAFKQSNKENNADTAIITTHTAVVKSAPDNSGSDLFIIHEGVKLQILDQVGNWTKIRIADGKTGWAEKADFERI